MGIIVQKYGGTSVADAERIQNVARRIARGYDAGHSMVVIVSAMGDTTDHLVALANSVNKDPAGREMDMLLATGEQQTIALLAMALQAMGYDAVSFTGWQAGIITEALPGRARITGIDPQQVKETLAAGKIAIIAGFQGVTEDGQITTLGRGGSDTTAVAIAASLQADCCEIFTDVDGVYTTDPRVVPAARKIERIEFDEMLELATMGAGVLHPRCVEVGKASNTCIHVRSSFNDNHGTVVNHFSGGEQHEAAPVSGIAFERDVTKISIFGVPDKPGVAAKIFRALADQHINVDMIIQGSQREDVNTISFTTSAADLTKARHVMEEIKWLFHALATNYEQHLSKVSIIGAGMITNPGVAARMFELLAESDVNIELIATSEIKVSCVVKETDLERAVNALHQGFGLENHPPFSKIPAP